MDTINENTRAFYDDMVKHPGKFEGENSYIPYLYFNVVMQGFSDDEEDENGVLISTIELEANDYIVFPELKGKTEVKLYEREDGFIIEL